MRCAPRPTARQALEAIAEAPPDMLLLDLMMPRGNGYDICRTLRALARYDGVRIVMLTARGQDSDQRKGSSSGPTPMSPSRSRSAT